MPASGWSCNEKHFKRRHWFD